MGDFNWVTPDFLAFASPQHAPVAPIPQNTPEFAALPFTVSQVNASPLPLPFKNVLSHFSTRNVGLVVRLNSELYSPSYFTALGMSHIDMIFEDGTCPPLPLVRRFIKMAHEMITVKNKGIAVHCKAGLGRTGCLIGAYLIYRHGFTANEVIAFMRFMRPGMVVGPQQHWLHLNQGSFREWWIEDAVKEKLLAQAAAPSTPGRVSKQRKSNSRMVTPPNGGQSKRAALGEIDHNEAASTYADETLPAPTPGQPRKSHRKVSRQPYARAASTGLGNGLTVNGSPSRSNGASRREDRADSDEDIHSAMNGVSTPRTPKHRSVSQSAAMTPEIDIHEDVENWVQSSAAKPRTPGGSKSGNGLGMSKVRSSTRRQADKSDTRGIRKASGRIGSAGTTAARLKAA